MKKTKIVEFVKNHKKEILITAVAGVVGMAIGYRPYVNVMRKHGGLIDAISKFKGDMPEINLIEFLKCSNSVQPLFAVGDITLEETVSEELLQHCVKNCGLEKNDVVPSVLIGIKK